MKYKSRVVKVGPYSLGGNNPVRVQSMCNTDTRDVQATVRQILALEKAGCEIVRVTVPDMVAAKAVGKIKKKIHIPLVVDIHFDYKLALECVAQGADKIRINPGNIGSREKVEAVVKACKAKKIPIRIGVNSGSIEKDLVEKYGIAEIKKIKGFHDESLKGNLFGKRLVRLNRSYRLIYRLIEQKIEIHRIEVLEITKHEYKK